MKEINVKVLDEDLIKDLVTLLEELETSLASMSKHLNDLKAILHAALRGE